MPGVPASGAPVAPGGQAFAQTQGVAEGGPAEAHSQRKGCCFF